MMEQLAERRMQREEDAERSFANPTSYGHQQNGNMHHNHAGHQHGNSQDDEEYDEDEEEEDYDSQEDDYESEEMVSRDFEVTASRI